MIDTSEIHDVPGRTARSQDGEKIGQVGQVFLDDQSGRPEFLTVNTGLFGTNESFVPAAEASLSGDDVVVRYSKDKVKDAPNVSVDDDHLSESQEDELYAYYGLTRGSYDNGTAGGFETADGTAGIGTTTETRDTPVAPTTGGRETVGHDTSGPTTDDAMTRSEERLHVGTERQEAGRARLRKYVVTEEEQVTVPVTKERAVLEREPVTDANVGDATSGPAISEEEHEVVLTEERPVVDKTVEPVERVRLATERETTEESVNEEVRKERIDTEGDVPGR